MEEQENNDLCKGTINLEIKELEELFGDIADVANEIRDVIKDGVDNNTYILLYILGKQVEKALFDIGDILETRTE